MTFHGFQIKLLKTCSADNNKGGFMGTAWRFKWRAAALAVIMMVSWAFVQDLPKIAVYVTGDVPNNEKDALGTRMLASLVNSGRYKGIERSNAFLAEIEKEHVRQRSGAIDDGQISELGRQFGVKFICIASITPAFGEFQVSARIVNVETAEVDFIGESSGQLKSMDDLSRISDKVVENMFGGKTSKAQTPAVAVSQPKPTSGTTLTDSRDGKSYRKITVGGQTWMAENLNYVAEGGKCYKNNPSNCVKYGHLYDWSTARQACPAGWHLASDAEWEILEKHVGGSKTAGTKLKSATGWGSYKGAPASTDKYGFSALPGGGKTGGALINPFFSIGNGGVWWTATEIDANNAWSKVMSVDYSSVKTFSHHKTGLFSVRCVQDE
jgi:uncharacterized protein (TIGR02145 family)